MILKRVIRITIDPFFLIFLPLLFFTNYLKHFIMIFFSILLHESGHIAVALLTGGRVFFIRILPVGLNASIDENACRKWERLLIFSAGPLISMLLFFACTLLKTYFSPDHKEDIVFLANANLYLAGFNMIPVLPLDGGKLLRELLSDKYGLLLTGRCMRYISYIVTSLFIVFGITQVMLNIYNISLLLIGIHMIFATKYEKTEAALMSVKNVIYRRSRLLRKGIYTARDLVVIKTVRLSEVLKSMDFDRFHIIHVLDDDLKLVRMYTEQEIIDGIMKYSADITFEEFIKK